MGTDKKPPQEDSDPPASPAIFDKKLKYLYSQHFNSTGKPKYASDNKNIFGSRDKRPR